MSRLLARPLMPQDLMSLEAYARERPAFRAQVIAHKQPRTIAVGPHSTWCFEDRLTIQYQIQEMLRVERIFEAAAIQEELDAYNPLIPDGSNWKVTLLLEYPDPEERARALASLKGVESRCYVEITGRPRIFALADEDLDRENEEKTSSVHFLRFELSELERTALGGAAELVLGIDHPNYQAQVVASPATRSALLADLATH